MQPLMPRMSPAEEQRELKARLRREGMLQAVVAACLALIDLVDTGVITKDSANMSPKMIQQKFHHNEDRAIQQGAVGEVLRQVGIPRKQVLRPHMAGRRGQGCSDRIGTQHESGPRQDMTPVGP